MADTKHRLLLIAAALGTLAAPASAHNILITNDDGFETANIRALYEVLVADGHSVIISAPTQNQSGQGGRVDFLRPIGPLAIATRFGTVPAGSPGVGVDPNNPRIFYVDGSPVASLLYGLDVLAPRFWGKAPDLVISGPNEGNNTGAVVISSGTVSAALYATNRGIPSIAISDGISTGRPFSSLVPGDHAYEVAKVVTTIIGGLDRVAGGDKKKKKKGVPLLPKGAALNVNVPAPTASCTKPRWKLTKIGTATSALPVFYENISTSPIAQAVGLGGVNLPAVGIVTPGVPLPAGVSVPADTSLNSEANAVGACRITMSFMTGVPGVEPLFTDSVEYVLRELPK